eukprot:scaffold84880_cov31-Prasinocladus_malaysianus.AAC.1
MNEQITYVLVVATPCTRSFSDGHYFGPFSIQIFLGGWRDMHIQTPPPHLNYQCQANMRKALSLQTRRDHCMHPRSYLIEIQLFVPPGSPLLVVAVSNRVIGIHVPNAISLRSKIHESMLEQQYGMQGRTIRSTDMSIRV